MLDPGHRFLIQITRSATAQLDHQRMCALGETKLEVTTLNLVYRVKGVTEMV